MAERKYPTLAEQHARRCIHWAGMFGPGMVTVTKCDIGIEYDSVSTVHPHHFHSLPCFREHEDIPCARRHFPTPEECEAHEQEVHGRFKRIAAARGAIIAKIGTQRGVSGILACPICQDGTLEYSRANVNGHIHARCTTEGCVSWME